MRAILHCSLANDFDRCPDPNSLRTYAAGALYCTNFYSQLIKIPSFLPVSSPHWQAYFS